MIDLKNKFVYLHITKTGGSSVEKALKTVLSSDTLIFQANKWRYNNFVFDRPLNHLKWCQIKKTGVIDSIKDFYIFTIVRNPWSRVISECFCPHIQFLYKDCKTVKDRIIKICQLPDDKGYAGHGATQYSSIEGVFEHCSIYKFEQLQEAFDAICDNIGIHGVELKHTNKNINKKANDYRQYYDEETIQMVRDKYSLDIEMFGYNFG